MNEHKRIRQTVWRLLIVLAILQPAIAFSSGAVRIHLTRKAKVDSEQISLAQIADVLGPDPEEAAAMGGVSLGRSPLPGQSLWLDPGKVARELNQHGWKSDRFEITGAGPVKVTRNYATVSAEKMKAALTEFIKRHAPWQSDQMTIRPIRYRQTHQLPPGEATLVVTAPKHTDWLGAIPFRVAIKVDGRMVKRTSIPVYIEVWQDVVLTAKPIGKNQPITAGDLQVKRMNLARVPSKAVFQPDQVIGKRANRTIAANTVLRSDRVHEPLMIRKGDIVQVLAESKVLRITTQALARENGTFGDNIEVVNLKSKKKIFAQVVDAQTVKVDF
jgi:flagella basal body P-ring formation protein FlgA